ncbi:MAG: response regulator [Actinobacteria bacterium]|nr:response regulator [Actinomycetota bacterium]
MRVLIIEDEQRLARNIARVLTEVSSYAVDVSLDGEDGQHMSCSESYDLIILDLMLPKRSGLDILRAIRKKGLRTPVLILTARDTTEDIIQGLDLGCDDYLSKPFDMGELIARCKALIRRSYDRPNPVIRVGVLEINTASREVCFAGKVHILPAMEYRLLAYLAVRSGEVVSKEDILDHLYDFDSERFSNVVEVYISSLRRRFDPALIRTVRSQGYVLRGDKL